MKTIKLQNIFQTFQKIKTESSLNEYIVFIQYFISFAALFFALFWCFFNSHKYEDYDLVQLSLSNDRIFGSINTKEILAIQRYFKNLTTGFDIHPATFIYKITLDIPPKDNITKDKNDLENLSRTALVIIQRGDTIPPQIESYRINLDDLNNLKLASSFNQSNPQICVECYLKRPINTPDDWVKLNNMLKDKLVKSKMASLIEQATCGLTFRPLDGSNANASYVTLQIFANHDEKSTRSVWMKVVLIFSENDLIRCFKDPYVKPPCGRTITIDSQIWFLVNQTDFINWTISATLIFSLHFATDVLKYEKVRDKWSMWTTLLKQAIYNAMAPSCYSAAHKPSSASRDFSRPIKSVSRLAWKKWQMTLGWSMGSGPIIFDSYFNSHPVFFEMSLQEVVAHSSNERHDIQSIVMTGMLLASSPIKQLEGVDCPKGSLFFDQVLWSLDGPRIFKNAFCIYDESLVVSAMRRGTKVGGTFARTKSFGFEDNVLVIQTTIFFSNLYYSFHFAFGEFGDIEVFVTTRYTPLTRIFLPSSEELKWEDKDASMPVETIKNSMRVTKIIISFKIDIDVSDAKNNFAPKTLINVDGVDLNTEFEMYHICNRDKDERSLFSVSLHSSDSDVKDGFDHCYWQSYDIVIGQRYPALNTSTSMFNSFIKSPHYKFEADVYSHDNFEDLVAWVTLGKKILHAPHNRIGDTDIMYIYIGQLEPKSPFCNDSIENPR